MEDQSRSANPASPLHPVEALPESSRAPGILHGRNRAAIPDRSLPAGNLLEKETLFGSIGDHMDRTGRIIVFLFSLYCQLFNNLIFLQDPRKVK